MHAMNRGARQAADAACGQSLVRVDDRMPGYRRVRRGKHFAYLRPDGRPLRDADEVARIRALAIPPAYRDVWICPLAHGHLQATGIDARGRKQYRYHPLYRAEREETKFERLAEFGRALPRIRARVARDLQAAATAGDADGPPVLPRERVLATVVRLLDSTCVRIGNDAYQRENGSYGLTTLRSGHARVRGSQLRLAFRGKGGVPHDVSLEDAEVARVVRDCQRLPGQALFGWHGGGGDVRRIDASDVNRYLCEAAGTRCTAKDFRTWHGSVEALELARQQAARAERRGKAQLKPVIAGVAERLRNTAAVCRKSYIHPAVLDFVAHAEPHDWHGLAAPPRSPRGLKAAELRLLHFLEQRPPDPLAAD